MIHRSSVPGPSHLRLQHLEDIIVNHLQNLLYLHGKMTPLIFLTSLTYLKTKDLLNLLVVSMRMTLQKYQEMVRSLRPVTLRRRFSRLDPTTIYDEFFRSSRNLLLRVTSRKLRDFYLVFTNDCGTLQSMTTSIYYDDVAWTLMC